MLQSKLKIASKQKLHLEMQMFKLHNMERSLCEEIQSTTTEIDLLTEELEDLKDKISKTTHQTSQLEIQKLASETKMDYYVSVLDKHKNDFEIMFTEERYASELRTQELKQREEEELQAERQRQQEIERQHELQALEARAVEEECDNIERECSVLKKRNNAIMLKLRRKLIETEESRRQLINKTEEIQRNQDQK